RFAPRSTRRSAATGRPSRAAPATPSRRRCLLPRSLPTPRSARRVIPLRRRRCAPSSARSSPPSWSRSTTAARTGRAGRSTCSSRSTRSRASAMEPVDRSTIWPYDERGEPRDFYYSRYGHPTGAAAERRLGELEGGDALLYAAGTGAVTSVLLAFARPGAKVALADACYYGTTKPLGL